MSGDQLNLDEAVCLTCDWVTRGTLDEVTASANEHARQTGHVDMGCP